MTTKRPQSNLQLIKRVLGDGYLELELERLSVEEGRDGTCSVVVQACDTSGAQHRVTGQSSGIVGACFHALLERYAQEYQSLKSIELADFQVTSRMDTKQEKSGVDAMATVTLDVRNSEGTMFSFSDESRSIVSSSARTVLAVVEYFVNAERAFITLYNARKDAQERNREDLLSRYTQEMAEVVKSTSYTEVIDNIRRELH